MRNNRADDCASSFARDLFLGGGLVQLPSASRDGHHVLDAAEVELTGVRTEQRFDGYQPDVIGIASDRPLLIEIAVTHTVSPHKAALIRRQRMEAFELVIKPESVPGTLSRATIEDQVRRHVHRHWIFNEKPENYLYARYHLDGVRPRVQPATVKSAALARLYDRLAHQEMRASLQRIVERLDPAGRREFEDGIGAWWTRPVDGSATPLDIVKAGDYRWTRLKQQVAAIERALNANEPRLFDPRGLPMSAAAAAWAAKAASDENERGRLRCERLYARALQKFGPEIATIWLSLGPSQRGPSPLDYARTSEAGLQDALRALERRFVNTSRIPIVQQEFKAWVERRFRRKGLSFIQTQNDGLPDRRTPLQCCYDDESRVQMQGLVEGRRF